MNFEFLKNKISDTNTFLANNAVKAINVHLTLRNWLVGYYILEFEQNGEDRAEYGAKLLQKLAKELKIKGLTAPELSRCRQFYDTYSDFKNTILTNGSVLQPFNILGSLTQEFDLKILGSPTQELTRMENEKLRTYYFEIFSKISYTHFVELIKIKEATKRKFYEVLTIKSTLSVRELEKQIATLSYERVGLGNKPEKDFEQLKASIKPQTNQEAIKSIYLFDFLGLPNQELISENHLYNPEQTDPPFRRILTPYSGAN